MRVGLLFVVIVLAIAGAFTVTARASADSYGGDVILSNLYQRIDEGWQSEGVNGVRRLLDNGSIQRFEQRKVLSDWARKNFIYSTARNPQIGFIYAEVVKQMADEYRRTRNLTEYHEGMKIGLAAFLASQLIAFENIARCADKTVGQSYLAQWLSGPLYEGYKKYLGYIGVEERSALWAEVADLAGKRNLNRRYPSLCASGAVAIARAQVEGDCGERSGAGGTVNCNSEKYVTFRDDEAWNEARAKLQEAVKRRVEEGKL